LDTLIATAAGLAVDQTVISRAEAVRTAVGAALNEIKNARRLPPGRMAGADTDLNFV
jgi:indole-3-acetate monooxygenase